MDGVAKIAVQRVYIASVPRHLYGMANGTLYAAGGGEISLGDLRIQALGNSVDVLGLIHREQNGIAQKLIALDVRRNADLVQNFRNRKLVAVGGDPHTVFGTACQLDHMGNQHIFIKGLHQEKRKAIVQQNLLHLFALKRPRYQKNGFALAFCFVALFDRYGIQPGHKGIQQHHIRLLLEHGFQHAVALFFANSHGNVLFFERTHTHSRNLASGIRHQKSNFIHCFLPPSFVFLNDGNFTIYFQLFQYLKAKKSPYPVKIFRFVFLSIVFLRQISPGFSQFSVFSLPPCRRGALSKAAPRRCHHPAAG